MEVKGTPTYWWVIVHKASNFSRFLGMDMECKEGIEKLDISENREVDLLAVVFYV